MIKLPQDCTTCKNKKEDPDNPYKLLDPKCKECRFVKVRTMWEKK